MSFTQNALKIYNTKRQETLDLAARSREADLKKRLNFFRKNFQYDGNLEVQYPIAQRPESAFITGAIQFEIEGLYYRIDLINFTQIRISVSQNLKDWTTVQDLHDLGKYIATKLPGLPT